MPYKTVVEHGRHVVKNAKTGRVLGRHASAAGARAQITAVNISEHQGEPGVPKAKK